MADQRDGGISWTDETWNPIRGCSKVSEGCRNCYAMHMAARFAGPGQPYEGLALASPARWTGEVQLVTKHLDDPLRWQRPRRIFVNSMSDLFHENLPFTAVAEVVAVMALAHRHTFQVLTKRPERMALFLATGLPLIVAALERRGELGQGMASRLQRDAPVSEGLAIRRRWPLPNVWWGASVEDQAAMDKRLPDVLACRDHAAVLWLSIEPMLGQIKMDVGYRNYLTGHRCVKCGRIRPDSEYSRSKWGAWYSCGACGGALYQGFRAIDLVVVGGESGGQSSRPMDPEYPRLVLSDVTRSNRNWEQQTVFHFKQWGDWAPLEQVREVDGFGKDVRSLASGQVMVRVGKKAAGNVLDGRTWAELPTTKKAG